MGKPPRVPFITYGYGEDTASARIARGLTGVNPGYEVRGFPAVGAGKYYTEAGIELACRGVELPSEGFVRGLKDLLIYVKTQTKPRTGESLKGSRPLPVSFYLSFYMIAKKMMEVIGDQKLLGELGATYTRHY